MIRAMDRASRDPMLQSLPWQRADVGSVLNKLALQGTALQRAAMARHLTPECGYAFPQIEMLARGEAGTLAVLELIEACIEMLARHYNVPKRGDTQSIAYAILNRYGGLSVADLLMFFQNCQEGRYRLENQFINTQGINAEFLFTWLEQYAEERAAARDAAYQQFRDGSGESGTAEETAAKINTYLKAQELIKVSRAALEMDADGLRRKWHREIYETTLPDGKVYPLERYRPGGAERLLKRYIWEYVIFKKSAEHMQDFYNDLYNSIEKKYQGEKNPDALKAAEIKTLIQHVEKYRAGTRPDNFMIKVFQELGVPKEVPAGQGEKYILRSVGRWKQEVEKGYFDEYLPNCIEISYPALSRQDYTWKIALLAYVDAGFENPVKKLLSE
jgi:hypothetical protein